ncbi:MAG: hypothetical protein ACFE8G_00920 [Candidatus Hermodarchaeota archaeon]
MISKVLIIKSSGILCYSKSFYSPDNIDDDIVSGFLKSIFDISQKIGGGEIRLLKFRNFSIIYSYDDEKYCIFLLITDIDDPEEEIGKLELLKTEFIKRYHDELKNWDSDTGKFENFNGFVENHIFTPPKILLVGEDGVGKTSILNLFPGELVIELDEHMNAVIQKSVNLTNFRKINKFILREVNLQEILNNPKAYKRVLDTFDIVCLVTNSGATNLSKTQKSFSLLKVKVKKADFYIIANFQDLNRVSFKPNEVQELFGVKTFGFSTKLPDAKDNIYLIIKEMLSFTFYN